jgi:hypothetical protein
MAVEVRRGVVFPMPKTMPNGPQGAGFRDYDIEYTIYTLSPPR